MFITQIKVKFVVWYVNYILINLFKKQLKILKKENVTMIA